jgi:hypothetical protein
MQNCLKIGLFSVGYKFHHVAQQSAPSETVNLAEPIKNVEIPLGKSDVDQFL